MIGAILVVEGIQDVRLYRKFALPIPHSRTILADGKPTLVEAMRILEKRETKGVLGICDADFDRVLGFSLQADIQSADHHDAEIMIAYSNAFEQVLIEASNGAIESEMVNQIRDSLMEIAARIGRLRLWNKMSDARVTFKGIDAGEFLSADFTFDLHEYVSKILENGPSTKGDIAELLEVADSHYTQMGVSDLAVGHDFVSLVNSHVEIINPGTSPGREVLEKMLRLAFDSASFRKTELSQAIAKWEERTGFEVLIEEASQV